MVLETFLATTRPLASNPIRHRERSAMPDNSTIPADGETISKPDGNAGKRTTVWSHSMQIWHDKVPVGTEATDLLSPYTVTLRSIVDIVMQGITEVDTHVNCCVPNTTTSRTIHWRDWKDTRIGFQIPDHCINLRKMSADSRQRHHHAPLEPFQNVAICCVG